MRGQRRGWARPSESTTAPRAQHPGTGSGRKPSWSPRRAFQTAVSARLPSDQRGDLRASWVQSRVRSVHHACRRGLRLPTPLSRRERPAEPLRKHLPGVDALGPGRPGGAGRAAALGDARSPWTAGHCPPAGRAVSLCADPGRPPGCQKQLPRVTARNARGDSCIRAPLMGRDRQARPSPRPTS